MADEDQRSRKIAGDRRLGESKVSDDGHRCHGRHLSHYHQPGESHGHQEGQNPQPNGLNNETREERYVGVPEEGGRNAIASDPLPPGNVYTACVSPDSKVGLYRIEVNVLPGSGKLRVPGGMDATFKQSLDRAFTFVKSRASDLGLVQLLAG